MEECVHRTQMPLLLAKVNMYFFGNQGTQPQNGKSDKVINQT
jgi:hypothetical protein